MIVIAGCFAVAAGAGIALRDNPALNRTWGRFANLSDSRPRIWEDTQFAVRQYWPAGAGVGSFTTVFPAAERLEGVHGTVTNRAHQDYLEFVLETGAAGILLLVAGLLAIGYRAVAIIRGSYQHRAITHCIFGIGALTILALHSFVDYPLRSISLATIAAFSLALLSRLPEGEARGALMSTRRLREAIQ
jgi:O-antigen ligase